MKFYIETLGCKVNSYESNIIEQSLQNEGFILVKEPNIADIIIINTCTVTNVADNKSLKTVRRLKRENEKAILVVCGCSVQNNNEPYKEIGIDILLGNQKKSELVSLIKEQIQKREKYEYLYTTRNLEFEDMFLNKFDHTRAFIKIQDGCDNFCSYCIIPFVRGKCRSKDFNKVIEESKELVSNGHKEIVLTGIHTGSYNDNGKDLVDVILEMSKIDGLERIRLSSVEITELDEKFMEMLKTTPKFCDHLHVPLQAGSEHVLKVMNRKYDLKYFFDKIKKIRDIRPNISISTDVIVGHPHETIKDFEDTLKTCRELNFSKIHVFPFSKREGTKAAMMDEVVSPEEKKRRVKELMKLSNELEQSYYDSFKGSTVKVLIEEVKDNYSVGHTSNYLSVKIPQKLSKNEIYEHIL